MAQIRHHHNSGATAIPWSTLQDSSVSYTARGVLGYCLSLPPGWEYSAQRIAKACEAQGKAAVLSALKELEVKGYRRVVTERGARGRITSYAEFSAVPMPEWIEENARKEVAKASQKKRGPKASSALAREEAQAAREKKQVSKSPLVFPQVGPESKKPESGEPGSGATRVSAGGTGIQETGIRKPGLLREIPTERETHTDGDVGNREAHEGSKPVCVEEFLEDAHSVIRGAIDPEADLRLDRPDREVLASRITVLLDAGWTYEMLKARLGGRTNAGTRRPDIVLGKAVAALEAEEPPTGRADARKVWILKDAIDRANRLFRDQDWQLTRVTTWLNKARLHTVEAWMDQADEEVLAQARTEAEDAGVLAEDAAPAPRVASVLAAMTTDQVRSVAADRATELGMGAEAAKRWADSKPKYKLLPWLQADEHEQRDQLPLHVAA